MADSKETPKKRQLKKQPTVRERAEKTVGTKKTRHIRRAGTVVAKPFKSAARIGRKEYYLPIPDNKVGRTLNKRRKVTPSYFRKSWEEVKLVKWPSRKETIKLTIAVFLFAIFFSVLVALLDFGLDKIFKQLILK